MESDKSTLDLQEAPEHHVVSKMVVYVCSAVVEGWTTAKALNAAL